jgi:hypothetical protein
MSRCFTIFAVPPASFDELTELCQQSIDALYKFQDDRHVLANQLHRRADAVALARVIITDKAVDGGFVAACSFVHRKVSNIIDKPVLSPEDCRELAQALAALRERVPNEVVLVRMKERGYEMAMAAEREDDLTRAKTTRRTLYAVPVETMSDLRGKRPRAPADMCRGYVPRICAWHRVGAWAHRVGAAICVWHRGDMCLAPRGRHRVGARIWAFHEED